MARAPSRPIIGEAAPPIVAIDVHGVPWRLADQRGRIQLLIFHRHIH